MPLRKKGYGQMAQKVTTATGCCVFCGLNKDCEELYGKLIHKDSLTVHYFCMLFASGLCQNGDDETDGLYGFLRQDILKEVRRATRWPCAFCKVQGATIGCVVAKCRVVCHLPCGLENGVLNQFKGKFCSYCEAHRPQQSVPKDDRGAAKATCSICMCNVEARSSLKTLRAPCCKNSWFHKQCLQRHATCSGLHFFKCPLCNNKDLFQKEMLTFGIYIPDQDAAWEQEPNAFQELLQRYSHCDAEKCKCPRGPDYAKLGSKWEMMLCDWCGSQGTHLLCGSLKTPMDDWVCRQCQVMEASAKKAKASRKNSKSPKASQSNKKDLVDSDWLEKKLDAMKELTVGGTKRKRSLETTPQRNAKRHKKHHRHRKNGDGLASSTVTLSSLTTEASGNVEVRDHGNRGVALPGLETTTATTQRRKASKYLEQKENTIDIHKMTDEEFKRLPKGLRMLLKEDIFTGNNLGTKFVAQRPSCSPVPTPDPSPSTSDKPTKSKLPTSRPRWYRSLMSQDIVTGKNLGQKFASQFQDARTSGVSMDSIGNLNNSSSGTVIETVDPTMPRLEPTTPEISPSSNPEMPVLDKAPSVASPRTPFLEKIAHDLSKQPSDTPKAKTTLFSPQNPNSPHSVGRRKLVEVSSNSPGSAGRSSPDVSLKLKLRKRAYRPKTPRSLPSTSRVAFSKALSQRGLRDSTLAAAAATPTSRVLPLRNAVSEPRLRRRISILNTRRNTAKRPRWFSLLVKDDIITGSNLGAKFARQFQARNACHNKPPSPGRAATPVKHRAVFRIPLTPQPCEARRLGARVGRWTAAERVIGRQLQVCVRRLTASRIRAERRRLRRERRATPDSEGGATDDVCADTTSGKMSYLEYVRQNFSGADSSPLSYCDRIMRYQDYLYGAPLVDEDAEAATSPDLLIGPRSGLTVAEKSEVVEGSGDEEEEEEDETEDKWRMLRLLLSLSALNAPVARPYTELRKSRTKQQTSPAGHQLLGVETLGSAFRDSAAETSVLGPPSTADKGRTTLSPGHTDPNHSPSRKTRKVEHAKHAAAKIDQITSPERRQKHSPTGQRRATEHTLKDKKSSTSKTTHKSSSVKMHPALEKTRDTHKKTTSKLETPDVRKTSPQENHKVHTSQVKSGPAAKTVKHNATSEERRQTPSSVTMEKTQRGQSADRKTSRKAVDKLRTSEGDGTNLEAKSVKSPLKSHPTKNDTTSEESVQTPQPSSLTKDCSAEKPARRQSTKPKASEKTAERLNTDKVVKLTLVKPAPTAKTITDNNTLKETRPSVDGRHPDKRSCHQDDPKKQDDKSGRSAGEPGPRSPKLHRSTTKEKRHHDVQLQELQDALSLSNSQTTKVIKINISQAEHGKSRTAAVTETGTRNSTSKTLDKPVKNKNASRVVVDLGSATEHRSRPVPVTRRDSPRSTVSRDSSATSAVDSTPSVTGTQSTCSATSVDFTTCSGASSATSDLTPGRPDPQTPTIVLDDKTSSEDDEVVIVSSKIMTKRCTCGKLRRVPGVMVDETTADKPVVLDDDDDDNHAASHQTCPAQQSDLPTPKSAMRDSENQTPRHSPSVSPKDPPLSAAPKQRSLEARTFYGSVVSPRCASPYRKNAASSPTDTVTSPLAVVSGNKRQNGTSAERCRLV